MVFIKTQASSVIASMVDFAITAICVELLGIWYLTGAVTGSVCGGITSFVLGRNWVFKKEDKQIRKQVMRYIVVWNGSILLNAAGVYVFTHYLGLQYLLSKVLVAVTIGFTYNYALQKKYVFGKI